jgi:hypothetical protein
MRAHQALDGVSQCTGRGSVATATGRKQNKPRVTATVDEAFRGYWAEVLDVVGHNRSLLACRRVEYVSIGSLHQIRTLTHRFDVEATLTQDARYLVR